MIKGNPCGHYVLIKPQDVETVSEGGVVVVLEENVKLEENASIRGTVVAIGSTAWQAIDRDVEGWEPWAEVGDDVGYKRHVSDMFKDEDGKKYFLMTDENILVNYSKWEREND